MIFRLGVSGKDGQGPGVHNSLVKESATALIASENDLRSGALDMEQFGSLGKCKSVLLNHLNQLKPLLNQLILTSVEILEYLFLCLAFYVLSAIIYLIIVHIQFIEINIFPMLLS